MLVSRLKSRRVSRINATPGNPTFTRAGAAYDPYTGAVCAGEGTTNLLSANQSSVETDTTGFNVLGAGVTVTRDTSKAWVGAASARYDTPGTGAYQGGSVFYTTSTQGTYTGQVRITGSGLIAVWLRINYTDATNDQTAEVRVTLDGTFQRVVTAAQTSNGAKTAQSVELYFRYPNAVAGTFWVDGLQIEPKPYATAWTLGGTTRADAFTNQPRYPSIAGSVGVMVEEGTTNLALWSDDVTNAYWSKLNVTASLGAPDPMGGTTAAEVFDNTTSGNHNISRAGLLTVGQPGAVTAFARAKTLGWLLLSLGSAQEYAFFNLSTGVVGNKGTGVTAEIVAAGNGHYRCSISAASCVGADAQVWVTSGNGVFSYAGTGQSLYLGRIHVAAKAYPTSPVPTTSATATRAAETLAIPTAGVLSPSQGTIIVRANFDSYLTGTVAPGRHIFSVGNGTRQIFVRKNNNALQCIINNDAGTTVVNIPPNISPSVGWHTVGLRFSSSEVSLFFDGARVGSSTTPSGPMPTAIDPLLYLGTTYNGGASWWNQPIDALRISSLALSDAEMAQATAGPLIDVRGQTYAADFNGTLQQFGRPLTLADRLDLALL